MKIFDNILRTSLVLFACLSIVSCVKDKGSEGGIVNDVVISGLEGTYYVSPGDVLEVTPELVFTRGESSATEFEYKWIIYLDDKVYNTIEGRNLRLEISGDYAVNTNKESYYIITNTKTGVQYKRRFSISTEYVFRYGYLFLTQKTGGVNVDMMAKDVTANSWTLYNDVLDFPEEEYRFPKEGNGRFIVSYPDPSAPEVGDAAINRKRYSIWIGTDQNCARVNANDFSWKPSYALDNLNLTSSYLADKPVLPDTMCAMSTAADRAQMHYYYNGNWFSYQLFEERYLYPKFPSNVLYSDYGTEDNELQVEKVAGFTVGNAGGLVMYSAERHAFIGKAGAGTHTANFASSLVFKNETSDPNKNDNLYDFNRVNQEVLHISALNYSNEYFAIVHYTDVDEYWYIDWVQSRNREIDDKNYKTGRCKLDKNLIEGAKSFVAGRKEGSSFVKFLFVVTADNEVYRYNTSSEDGAVRVTDQVMPTGDDEIVLMKYVFDQSNQPGGQDALHVVTKNSSLPADQCCTLSRYTRNTSTGELTLDFYDEKVLDENNVVIETVRKNYRFTGIGDVIDFTIKTM